MRAIARFVLIAALIVGGMFAVNAAAQEEPQCTGVFLEPFAGNAAYESACGQFNVCAFVLGDLVKCGPDFFAERLAQCEAHDVLCIAQARLQTALIGLYQGNGYQAQTQPPAFWTELAADLLDGERVQAAALNGDAREWFAPLVDDYTEHPMLSYAFAVLDELNGDLDAAQAGYEGALAQNASDALIYLALGDLYAARDMTEEGAVSYALAAGAAGTYGLPEDVVARLGTLDEVLKLDLDTADDYALFPTLQSGGGPGGDSAYDMSLEPPTPVRLLEYGDSLLLAIADDLQFAEDGYRIILPFYALTPDGFGNFTWHKQEYFNGFRTSFVVTPTDESGVYTGSRSDTVFEGMRTVAFYLAPAGEGDPRPQGFRCENAPQTRMAAALFARPLSFFEPIVLYDEPGGAISAEIEQQTELIITIDEGPVCDGGFTYYHVTTTDVEGVEYTGWLRENADSTQYLYDVMYYD